MFEKFRKPSAEEKKNLEGEITLETLNTLRRTNEELREINDIMEKAIGKEEGK